MNDDDDLPVSFDLLVWGPAHSRVLTALARANLPDGVALTAGPAGATLKIPLGVQAEWIELLLGRLERAQLEGGLFVGVLPDRPLTMKRLREEWASALRIRRVAVKLTPKESTVPDEGAFVDNWWLDVF